MLPTFRYKARLCSVYDGDTMRFDIDLGFGVWLHNQIIRLYGIDTPELRGEERDEGLRVKAVVMDMLYRPYEDGGMVPREGIILQTYKDKKGKYGRWLAIVWIPSDTENTDAGYLSLNNTLLERGLAEEYKG